DCSVTLVNMFSLSFWLQKMICRFFFFFSSRRRHTRFSRDWSSDVCSSDLAILANGDFAPGKLKAGRHDKNLCAILFLAQLDCRRSEERRVGKECRSRWLAYHKKKKI